MQYSSNSLSTVSLGETTIVIVRGTGVQHLNLPEGKAVNIGPDISELVTLGDLNTIAFTHKGLYMIINSDRFNRVDVVDATAEDLWKFLASALIDSETQEQFKNLMAFAKTRFDIAFEKLKNVLERLPKDGYVNQMLIQLEKINWRSAYKEIIVAIKTAYPDAWEKYTKNLPARSFSWLESQIPEQMEK